jgi:hypothetical protein
MSTSDFLWAMEEKVEKRTYTHDDITQLLGLAFLLHSTIGDLKLQIEYLKAPDPFRRKH